MLIPFAHLLPYPHHSSWTSSSCAVPLPPPHPLPPFHFFSSSCRCQLSSSLPSTSCPHPPTSHPWPVHPPCLCRTVCPTSSQCLCPLSPIVRLSRPYPVSPVLVWPLWHSSTPQSRTHMESSAFCWHPSLGSLSAHTHWKSGGEKIPMSKTKDYRRTACLKAKDVWCTPQEISLDHKLIYNGITRFQVVVNGEVPVLVQICSACHYFN